MTSDGQLRLLPAGHDEARVTLHGLEAVASLGAHRPDVGEGEVDELRPLRNGWVLLRGFSSFEWVNPAFQAVVYLGGAFAG